MSTIAWATDESMGVFDAGLPLQEILESADEAALEWVVLERRIPGAADPVHYAYRRNELHAYARNQSDKLDQPAEIALRLNEFAESPSTAPAERPDTWEPTDLPIAQPSMLRRVGLDHAGRPEVIGELTGWEGDLSPFIANFENRVGAAPPPEPVDFGERRGGHRQRAVASDASAQPAPEVAKAVLSAEAAPELPLGEESIIDVRVELSDGAAPLAYATESEISLAEEITVILLVDRGALQVDGPRLLRLPPPAPGQPSLSAFTVVGIRPGATRISVNFRQGATDLGTVSFSVTIAAGAVATGTVAEPVGASLPALRREDSDDDMLVLLIEEERVGNRIYYGYRAFCKALRWNYQPFKSDFLQAAGSRSGTAALRYVRTIYQQILDRVLINSEDLRVFQDELEAIGTDMCRQLFDPEFVRRLWDHRDKIEAIQVTTQEPYIPWELLRLEHPNDRSVDDRFLGEYGLVRSFSGRTGPRDLRARDWRFLIGTYPNGTQKPIGREVDYLTGTLPGRSITPRAVPANLGDLLDTLKAPDFDVLHIACHGETDLKNVERSALIITDRRTGRGVEPVTITPATVLGKARLEEREPVIFLNACETGQQAPSLTDWGGWPRAFWDAGAGVFVGTSWSVYERPAAAFSAAFYDALTSGSTLAQAAAAGRSAAKAIGDGSWLAYVVYGNPLARISTVPR